MDYSHFHFPMSDSAYPVVNGYYPHSHTPNHHHQPSDFSSASSDFLPNGLFLPRDGSADVFDDLDDGDAESKTRLSPEQMAELEREFRMNHKPKTERKKVIAQRLRLQLPRVNVRLGHPLLRLPFANPFDRTGIRTVGLKPSTKDHHRNTMYRPMTTLLPAPREDSPQ